MSQAPETLQYQGQTIYLSESLIMANVKGNPIRHIYVDNSGEKRFVQCEFANVPIDWQRIQDENAKTRHGKTWQDAPIQSEYNRKRAKILKAAYKRLMAGIE